MDKFSVLQFRAFLTREVRENRQQFIGATQVRELLDLLRGLPRVISGLMYSAHVRLLSRLPKDILADAMEYAAILFDGLSPLEMAPLFMILAIPFMGVLYIVALIYLINTLYQDRRELSILFWQSMPVSNLKTVLSKIVTIAVVAPLFYIAILFVLYLVGMVWVAILGLSYDVQIAGLGYMFLAAVVSLILVYLSAFTTALWLMPSIGCLLRFSAFSKKTPLLCAGGVFFLSFFLEDFIFGTQFLANWVESRANPAQYLIFSFRDVFESIFNYDMLFGILVGSILIAGAVLMRRFAD